jgi:ATP adenylyltransferase
VGFLEALREATRRALAQGALAPIETVAETVDEEGVRFVVRRLPSLARKPSAGAGSPLVPWDERLFVAEVPPAHAMILNKFPVIVPHALLVSREFVPQEALLGPGDFQALAACLADWDALAFYNGGREAGASQAHRHLQLVPRALGEMGLPIEPLVARAEEAQVPGLRFAHACGRSSGAFGAAGLHRLYRRLLAEAGVREGTAGMQSAPYNLLATREWMMVVPRTREKFDGISVNALGFAGSLFVPDEAAAARLRRVGPMNVLAALSGFSPACGG